MHTRLVQPELCSIVIVKLLGSSHVHAVSWRVLDPMRLSDVFSKFVWSWKPVTADTMASYDGTRVKRAIR
jgi:hypothetical protein